MGGKYGSGNQSTHNVTKIPTTTTTTTTVHDIGLTGQQAADVLQTFANDLTGATGAIQIGNIATQRIGSENLANALAAGTTQLLSGVPSQGLLGNVQGSPVVLPTPVSSNDHALANAILVGVIVSVAVIVLQKASR